MALIPFEDVEVQYGQAGIPGTGVSGAEKTAILADLDALKAASYIVRTSDVTLSNEQQLASLSTGLLKVTTGTGVLSTATAGDLPSHTHTVSGAIEIVLTGNGATIPTGVHVDFRIPYAITVTEYNLFANQSGAIQIDLWRDTYGNFPPVNADSVTGSAPCIIPATGDHWAVAGAGLTGWDTTWDADDIIRVNVDSVTSIQRVTLVIKFTRSIT